jgi:hypothetical protein
MVVFAMTSISHYKMLDEFQAKKKVTRMEKEINKFYHLNNNEIKAYKFIL